MKYRNILKKRILAGLLAGAAACAAAPALAASGVVPNTQLPQGGNFVAGGGIIGDPFNGQMNITQNTQNGVIKWDGGFNIGANATVNFEGPQNGYNTLNYDASGNMSQIYGAINANNNGNIYIVNPAGVEISNSAQINVGSLYVSNRNLDDALKNLTDAEKANPHITNILNAGTTTDAALMSLGNINASQVTFDGDRIVIDTERLKTGDGKMTKENIIVHTTDKNSVVIGYDAYEETFNGTVDANTYEGKDKNASDLATVYDADGNQVIDLNAYMWVEDVEQLQAIDTNLGGNYALRNSIDATATQEWNNSAGFKPIGIDSTGKVIVENSKYGFHGNFDGLSYNIFNLNINRTDAVNVGLFGVLHEAEINNVTFVGGAITGGNVVGSLAGAVLGNTHVNNVMNSASVTGGADVGGIIGYSGDEINQEEDRDKPITVGSADAHFSNMVNTGTVVSSGTSDGNGGTISDAGGLIGNLYQGTLDGTSYNLGSVTGEGHNVGGLVGHAYASKLGDGTNLIYNRLDVTGAYNVGGIVGQMEGTTVQNAENSGTIAATGYTDGKYYYHSRNNGTVHVEAVDVRFANAGGIAGNAANVEGRESKIENVLNTGDVSSIEWNIGGKTTLYRYTGGNVGGIVGSAVDTNITNATNRENNIRGAINVGGVAGYFANSDDTNATKYTVTNGINDGGDILGSGLTSDNGIFATEIVRPTGGSNEKFTIGNIGGVVGYMDGDNVYITASANRGTVHTKEPSDPAKVQQYEKAANVGGIVGKIDRSHTKELADQSKDDYSWAAVSNSYNTGDVMGYTGVGGIAGMMYNGEIAGSYNLGYLRTTRQSALNDSIDALNMGGIVGDTTENSGAKVVLYDVYNKGQIGDEDFTYFGRHVGGIVGRLSGTVEKAYNTGAIYNGYNVVGGIAGWIYEGSIKNAFNTGNITVVNQNNATSQVGGIAGAASTNVGVTLENVYNLGTIRSFRNTGAGNNTVGGILGIANGTGKSKVSITNAYTTGNIWAGNQNGDNSYGEDTSNFVRSIWGRKEGSAGDVQIENTYYIRPDTGLPFDDLSQNGRDNSKNAIDFADKDKADSYKYTDDSGTHSLGFSSQTGGDVTVEKGQDWRIYEGSTPILNAFLPNAEDYFDQYTDDTSLNGAGIGSIQYGTAYDPLLTIIKANEKGKEEGLSFNWQDLKINNDAGLAVYGAGLTLNDFMSTGGSGYFGGLIYSDGALTLNAHLEGDTHDAANTNVTGDVALGSASQLYGSSVAINADGQVTIYGSVTATGNVQDGTSWSKDEHKYTGKIAPTDGSVSISGGSVDIYGQLTSADGQPVKVPGINGMAAGWSPETDGTSVSDPKDAMSDIGDRFSYTTGKYNVTGNISIAANDAEDGHVNVYYGNKGEGLVTTGGDLTVTASGDIYMDSDLSIGGNLTLNAGYKEGEDKPAADSEAVLDISNIGKVQAANDAPESKKTSVDYLHEFIHHFAKNAQDGGIISFTGGESKIAVDMWDEEINEGKGGFNLDKFDIGNDKFVEDLNHLNFTVAGDTDANAQKYTYIWVSTGEQLKGIQQYKKNNSNSNILSYNFALKNDIDASDVTDYEAIGTNSQNGYTGTFDGRDNRIIGLDTTKKSDGTTQTLTNAGIFDTIGAGGTVEDLRVYSGTFTGKDNAGAVAGVNKGNISNVTAFGNVVTAQGSTDSTELGNLTEEGSVHVGAAGGIAGVNYGIIDNASAVGTATAADAEDGSDALSTAGGIAGINMYDENINKDGGIISNSTSNSAVNASAESTYALGGVAGVNAGKLDNVDSLGVTTGLYKLEGHNSTKENQYSDNVGGIVGTNSGSISNAYNESIVSGRDNVGGIIGTNEAGTTVENVSNAASVTGEAGASGTSDYVGGLAGTNSGTITNGRNNGTITGNQYVGGLVGNNASADSKLENLVNDEAAAITGDNFVGGIAGSNAGTITAIDQQLVNRGSITGQTYVGGVAGVNTETGVITNTISSIALHVKTPYSDDSDDSNDPKYFGGVVGQNQGTIQGATNESSVDVAADGASMVGGIIGENTETGKLKGTIANKGVVSGKSDVGGIIGSNKNDDILNNSAGADRLIVSNSGLVKAEDGGAAGIFYKNTGAINNADLVNTGMVIGGSSKDSVTGGLFGKNSGEISNSTLTNNGTVYGGGTVGGLIGENKGNISHSSLINSTDGEVIGIQNVGGLIGVNTGDITGGRDENDGYYKYQIYNNGTITAGTWTDTNGDGMIDEGEITAGAAGNDIAGLFGSNSGKVTAAYNTGAVVAENSTNVGGIAGTNSGTLDQVFNTVMTGVNENGETQYGSITGNSNVGGLVGSNTGTISNAYNTSAVEGTTSGSLVGTNNGTVSNVYGSGADKLIGDGTEAVNVYDAEKDSFGENGSSIDMVGGQSAVWRQYGENNPILKIFLTTVTYAPTKNDQNLVYNGQDQTLDVTGSGFSAADKFETHNSVTGGLIYHDVDGAHKNAGNYTDYLWSEQIKAGGEGDTFNPNHLGYDVQSVDYTIDQKELTIDLGDVTHEYGSPNLGQYEGNFTVSGWVEGEDFSGDISLSDIKDEGLKDDTHTKDVGGYTWSANATINGTFGQGGAGNYKITAKPNAGKSTVTQKTITVNLNDVVHTYGDNQDESKYGIRDTIKWANDDTYTNGDVVLSGISDEAFDGTTGHTNNAGGDYSWTADVSGMGSDADRINQNYKFEVVKGDSDIEKKGITIELGDVSHVYGTPTKDGYTFTANGWVYDEDFSKDVNIGSLGDGITDNALKDNNHHTQDVNQYGYTWTTDKAGISGDGATNYYVESIVDGKSAVTPVTIDVELGDISHEYGTPNDDYGLKNDVVWANGDTYTNEDIILGNIQDEALKDGTPTKGVGDYIWEASVSGTGSDAERIKGNYVFNVKQGASTVTPKDLHIIVDDKDIYVGEPVPEYTGHMDDLVNGDTMTDAPVYSTDPAEEVNTAQTGSYDIGVQFGNNYISSGDGYDWMKVWDGFKNYNVIFEPGKLTISDMPVDRPSEGEHWNFLFDDNPWDRNRDFRERKAEVHFVAGGMTL